MLQRVVGDDKQHVLSIPAHGHPHLPAFTCAALLTLLLVCSKMEFVCLGLSWENSFPPPNAATALCSLHPHSVALWDFSSSGAAGAWCWRCWALDGAAALWAATADTAKAEPGLVLCRQTSQGTRCREGLLSALSFPVQPEF